MAWFSYNCPDHGNFRVTLERRLKKINCPKCGKESSAIINIGTSRIMERLDNGVMARAVERLHNVEEIMNERADNHSREYGQKIKEDE